MGAHQVVHAAHEVDGARLSRASSNALLLLEHSEPLAELLLVSGQLLAPVLQPLDLEKA